MKALRPFWRTHPLPVRSSPRAAKESYSLAILSMSQQNILGLSNENLRMLSHSALRMAWLVVALLWPVAMLNYLDRQMMAAMKFSIMKDIPSISLEANWGNLLAMFKWVYA